MLPHLETPRLALREMELADGPALAAFQSRPFAWRHMAVEPAEFADGTARVRRYLEHRGPDDRRRLFVYVAVLKLSGDIVGTVSLQRSHPAIASLGVGVSEDHVGRGLGTEMAARLLAFGFEAVRLHRIEADVATSNAACIRLLEKLGMTREGVARDCIHAQGRWWTEAKYAMLEDEHRRLQNQLPAEPSAA
jgi:[ribosomal protein S5]-alanine N-acetyltransferase